MRKFILTNRTHGNSELGYLSFFETNKDVPFDIKRIYYTYDVPTGTKRGMHAHKTLQQVLWCPHCEDEQDYIRAYEDFLTLIKEGFWKYEDKF